MDLKTTLSKMPILSLATFGAFLEATGTILERIVLKKHKIDSKDYTVFQFLTIVLSAIPIFLILSHIFPQAFSWKISSEALEFKNILIFFIIIFFSILGNLLIFHAMKWEKLTELEPIRLSQPLFIILLAFIIYSSERQTAMPILIAALIASIALIFSHLKKHHLQFNKYALAALFGSFSFAVEMVLSKSLLPYYSPLSIYFVRSLIILIICALIFKPNINSANRKSWYYISLTGFIWVLYRGILYYSYTLEGVIFTTLMFLLTPVFIYLFSRIYLKEKLNWRNIIASIIIVLCVLYALIINSS